MLGFVNHDLFQISYKPTIVGWPNILQIISPKYDSNIIEFLIATLEYYGYLFIVLLVPLYLNTHILRIYKVLEQSIFPI